MRNVGHIFLREYLQSVRSKAFIIITILAPVLFLILFGLPLLSQMRGSQKQKIAVAEAAGVESLVPLLREHLDRRNDVARNDVQLDPVRFEAGREAETRARLRADVIAGRLEGYLWFEGDPLRDGRVEYNAGSVSDFIGIRTLENAVSRSVVQRRLVARGVPAAEVQDLVRSTRLRTSRISAAGDREDRGMSFIMSFFFLMTLYVTLLIYGITVMRSVIEEKSSRIYEVLLGSVRPIELLAGKILGIAAVGLTQYLAWSVLSLVAGGGLGLVALRTGLGEISVPPHILFFFVLFFLLGFLLYSAMFAALGAMVNSEQETQQLQFVIMPFIIVPMLVAQLIIRAPNSTASIVLSLIPFFTPMLMFLRLTVVTPPAWQVALSIVLLLATIWVILWTAARIYRVGILMYGKRPTLPELVRWVRAA